MSRGISNPIPGVVDSLLLRLFWLGLRQLDSEAVVLVGPKHQDSLLSGIGGVGSSSQGCVLLLLRMDELGVCLLLRLGRLLSGVVTCRLEGVGIHLGISIG